MVRLLNPRWIFSFASFFFFFGSLEHYTHVARKKGEENGPCEEWVLIPFLLETEVLTTPFVEPSVTTDVYVQLPGTNSYMASTRSSFMISFPFYIFHLFSWEEFDGIGTRRARWHFHKETSITRIITPLHSYFKSIISHVSSDVDKHR